MDLANHLARMQPPRTTGRDTGVVFPHGAGGRDVRVRLLTDDADKAVACGRRLAEWGLTKVRAILALPTTRAVAAMDLCRGPVRYANLLVTLPAGSAKKTLGELMASGQVGIEGPCPISFGGDLLMLEANESEDVRRFAVWYDEKARRAAQIARAKPATTLTEMAKRGEIETIEAKDLT